jgi:hypothetical protein
MGKRRKGSPQEHVVLARRGAIPASSPMELLKKRRNRHLREARVEYYTDYNPNF